jgi:DNA-directed RNA polymerase subunit K
MDSVQLTKYERARIIGARSLQLAMGAPPLLEVKQSATPMHIASEELEQGVIPLVVIR